MKLIQKIKALLGFVKANPEKTRSALLALINRIAVVAKALKTLAEAAKDVKASADDIRGKADEILAATEQAKAELSGLGNGEKDEVSA